MKQFTSISKQFVVIAFIISIILGGIGYRAHASNQANQSANRETFLPLIMRESFFTTGGSASTATPTATETTTASTATEPTEVPNSCETAVDFFYVIDKSGSMAWSFPDGTIKMDVVKSALLAVNQDIYDANFNNRAGLVSYTTDDSPLDDGGSYLSIITNTIALTSTVGSLNAEIESMEPIGGTPVGAALEAARQLMLQADHDGRQLVIIHLTDGVPTVDKLGKYYPDTYVQQIKVYDNNGMPFDPDFVATTGSTPSGNSYYSDKPAGYVVAEVMHEALDLKQALPDAIVHGFAIQGDGFNTEVVQYVAETGGGNFYSINDTNTLKDELRQIFYDTSGCPEPTATPTNTPGPSPTPTSSYTSTPTATNTATPTLTPTPSGPYIILDPDCSTNSITITGYNWPIDYDIDLFWDTKLIGTVDDSEHSGTFSRTFACELDQTGTHKVIAETQSGPARVTEYITISCSTGLPPVIPQIPTLGPTPTPTSTPVVTATPDNGLIAYWSFDNSPGNDDSGNGHHGVVQGNPEEIQGVMGNALRFDGNDYLSVNNSPEFEPGTGNYSIAVWVRYREDSSIQKVFVATYAPRSFKWVQISGNRENNDIAFGLKSGTNPSQTMVRYNPILDNEWHFIVGVRDDVHQLKLYVDGVLVNALVNPELGYVQTYSPSSPIFIGYDNSYGERYNDGDMDELRIYNRALSPDEVEALYNLQDNN